MKHFFIVSVLFFVTIIGLKAQPVSAVIGINGATCSMCQRSVEKSLDRLKFIQSITASLDSTTMKVTFKQGADVSIYQLAEKVRSAGFSVRDMDVVFHFNQLAVSNNSDYTFNNATYHFINVGNKTLNGETVIRVIGNDYMARDEYKKYAASVTTPYTPFSPYYYVTILQ